MSRVPNGTHPSLVSINGDRSPVSPKDSGVEAVLDFDLAHGLLYPQEVTLYQTTSTLVEEKTWIKQYGVLANASAVTLYLPLIAALDGNFCTERERQSGADCGTIGELTKVLSVSYAAPELQAPEKAAKRVCAEFMKLALKGHTILFGSGDQGVGQNPLFTSDSSAPLTNGCKPCGFSLGFLSACIADT